MGRSSARGGGARGHPAQRVRALPPPAAAGREAVDPAPVRRAGGLVLGPGGRIAVVHRPRHDDWTFPKGRIEVGETAEECARREVWEETGFRCRSLAFAGHALQPRRRPGPPKVVAYWFMRPVDGSFGPGDEVDALRWVPVDDAHDLLTYPHDRILLGQALALPLAVAH